MGSTPTWQVLDCDLGYVWIYDDYMMLNALHLLFTFIDIVHVIMHAIFQMLYPSCCPSLWILCILFAESVALFWGGA